VLDAPASPPLTVCAGKRPLPQWTYGRGPPHKECGVLAPRAPARLCASLNRPLRIAQRLAVFGLPHSRSRNAPTAPSAASWPRCPSSRLRRHGRRDARACCGGWSRSAN